MNDIKNELRRERLTIIVGAMTYIILLYICVTNIIQCTFIEAAIGYNPLSAIPQRVIQIFLGIFAILSIAMFLAGSKYEDLGKGIWKTSDKAILIYGSIATIPAVIAIFACGLLFVFLLFMSFMCTIGANAPQAIKCYRCNVRYEIEKTGLSGMELLDTYKIASEILKLHPEAVKDMDEGFLKKLSSNS